MRCAAYFAATTARPTADDVIQALAGYYYWHHAIIRRSLRRRAADAAVVDILQRVRTSRAPTPATTLLARYVGGPLAGAPAVTSRTFPSGGRAIYVSAGLDAESIGALARAVVPAGDEPDLPRDMEMLVRESETEEFVFFINHGSADVSVTGTGVEMLTGTDIANVLDVPGGAVRVLRRPRR